MKIFFEHIVNSTYQAYKQLLRENFPNYPFFISSNIRFDGFELNWTWFGITYYDTEKLNNLTIYSKTICLNALYLPHQFGFTNPNKKYSEKYGFSSLRETIAHEIAHCLLMDFHPILGILHNELHEIFTKDIENYLTSNYEMRTLEKMKGVY